MSEIIMPKMGDAMTEGKVVRWYKKAGDPVKKGEPVLEIETDKVNLDLEAEADGVLGDDLVAEGATIEVGGVLATIVGKGGSAPKKEEKPAAEQKPVEQKAAEPPKAAVQPGEPREAQPGKKKPEEAPVQAASAAPEKQETATPADGSRRRSSPLARKMARELGVGLDAVSGTGPGGRIIAADIKKAAESGATQAKAAPAVSSSAPAPAKAARPKELYRRPAKIEGRQVPLTAMRRTIAKRLGESIGPIPHFFLTIEADVTQLSSLRQQMNEIEGMKVSVNDFVVRAAALALLHHPNVNASWGDEAIQQHGEVHIGIAVSTPEGLITPVVRNADQQSVPDISAGVRDLAERARNRKLRPDEYQGSTFTISNLGMYGIEEFTAIINPPNSAILAVGAAMQKAVVVDGQIVIRDRMKVTMSCDHRVIDGAAGAEYLRTLKQYLEQPVRLII